MATISKKGLTRTEIISRVAEKSGLNKNQTEALFSMLVDLAISEVIKNGEFTLPRLGKLVIVARQAHTGRNPATGKAITIPAKTTLKFRIGKPLKMSSGLAGGPTKPSEP